MTTPIIICGAAGRMGVTILRCAAEDPAFEIAGGVEVLASPAVGGTVGGLIGIGVGVILPWFVTYFFKMPTVVQPWSIMLSLGISVSVGMIFGIYPAVRAAGLDPIVALRHE